MTSATALGPLLEDPRIRRLGCRPVRAPAAKKYRADLPREPRPDLWKTLASFTLVARADPTPQRSAWSLWRRESSTALWLCTRPWEPCDLWASVDDADSVLTTLGPPPPRPAKIAVLVAKLGTATRSSGEVGVLECFYLADPDQMIATLTRDIQSLETLQFPDAIVDDEFYEDPRTFLPNGGRPSLMQRGPVVDRNIWLWCAFRACVAIAGCEQEDLSSVIQRVRLVYVRDATAANAARVARLGAATGVGYAPEVPFDVALVAATLEIDEERARAHVAAHQARVERER